MTRLRWGTGLPPARRGTFLFRGEYSNNHESTQCQKDRTEPAKCALCSVSHPANYRGCQTHKDLLKYRKLHLNPSQRNKKVHQFSSETNTTQEIPNSQNFPPLSKTPTISILPGNHRNHWSKNDIPAENNLTNQLSSFINELKSSINPMITLLTTVIEKLIKDGR